MSATPVGAVQRVVPLTRLRSAVAKTVTASAAIPQFTVEYDVEVAAMAAVRPQLPPSVSYTDMVHAAAARALTRHRRLNASWADHGIVEHASINLGFALAMESQDGLVVPSILGADRLSPAELAERRRTLTEAAREGRLKPVDVFSTTFTVSNLGPTGVSRFRALVLPPQAAILAVAATSARGTMTLALSCDHRVVDGLPAALFLRDVAELLQDPSWMLDATGSRS